MMMVMIVIILFNTASAAAAAVVVVCSYFHDFWHKKVAIQTLTLLVLWSQKGCRQIVQTDGRSLLQVRKINSGAARSWTNKGGEEGRRREGVATGGGGGGGSQRVQRALILVGMGE